MKYLSKFNLVNENVAQAKALLRKIKISESDPDFLKIKEMLKGHEGYVYWFTKLRFVDNQPVEELKNIWDIISDNNGITNYFTKKIVDLESVESFWDEYERAKLVSGAKKVLDQFPANQKRFFKLDNEEDFNLLVSLSKSKSLPALIRKISSFRDKATLIAAAQRLLTSSFDGKFGELLKLVDSVGADIKVADEENNIIICGVNYEQIRKLGGDTSWCIVRAESTFNSYASGGFQWVIFLVDNFGKNDRMSKIGFTTHFGYTTAHDKYDGYISKEALSRILSERGVNMSDFYISRENLQLMTNWDLVPVEILLDKKFTKPEIVKKKQLFRDKTKYQRQTISKSDIEFFTEEEISKWDLTERIEITWAYISSLDKETIIKKDLINRLDHTIYMGNIVSTLKITPAEILEYNIFKSPKVLIQANDIFTLFSKAEIIKYKIYDYVYQGSLYLDKFFNKDFTKEEIIKLEIYKSPRVLINEESLSYFKKDELIKYGIINRANNIPYDILFAAGFTKDEIIKSYSAVLDTTTKTVINFFKGKTRIAVKNRLNQTFWSSDTEALGVERDYLYKVKLIAMTLYDINFDMIGFKGLVSIFDNTMPIDKSNLEILSSLGFKITDKNSFDTITDLFKTGHNIIDKISNIIKFRRFFKSKDVAYDLCTDWLKRTLKGDMYFDYFDLIENKENLVCPEQDEIIAALKAYKKKRYAWDIKTKSDKKDSGFKNYNFENTVAFMKELRFTKEDIEEYGIEKFANIFEVDEMNYNSSDVVDKVIELIESYGIELDERGKIRVIRGVIKSIQSRTNDENGKSKIIYTEDYYKELIKRNYRLDDSLEWLFLYFKQKNKLSEYDEKSYRKLFEKGGDETIKRFEKELKFVKEKELQYKCLSDLKEIFRYSTASTKLTPEQWYNKYFETYQEIEPKIHSYNKHENDMLVIWLLASIDKLDKIDDFYNWDIISKNNQRGYSFDNNMLHTICKLLCKEDHNYDRYFKNVKLSDEQIKNLYELVLKNVDETQYWVKKYLAVCYYLYDKPKFDRFFKELLTIKNNYSYNKHDRHGEFKEKAVKTVRVDGIRYVLKYLAKHGNTKEIESLIDQIMAYRAPSTPRATKMTNTEFESTLEFISYLNGKNREYSNWRDNYVKEIKNKFTTVKESFLLNWSNFRS